MLMSGSIPAKVLPFKRKTWKPIVEDGDASAVTNSKFSGRACLLPDEDYPRCANCGKTLQLFVQLKLGALPVEEQQEFGKRGLVQMFYCTSEDPICETACEAFFPFAKSTLARLVEIGEEDNSSDVKLNSGAAENALPAKTITGWEELDDYPNTEELDELHVELSDEEREQLWETDYPRTGDKLAGYPAWVQGIEYPNCPICGKQMKLLFQIDSEDNLAFMFGDAGTAHLTQCREHQDQLAFGWACS